MILGVGHHSVVLACHAAGIVVAGDCGLVGAGHDGTGNFIDSCYASRDGLAVHGAFEGTVGDDALVYSAYTSCYLFIIHCRDAALDSEIPDHGSLADIAEETRHIAVAAVLQTADPVPASVEEAREAGNSGKGGISREIYIICQDEGLVFGIGIKPCVFCKLQQIGCTVYLYHGVLTR